MVDARPLSPSRPPPERHFPVPLPANACPGAPSMDYEPPDLAWLATLLLARALVALQEAPTP